MSNTLATKPSLLLLSAVAVLSFSSCKKSDAGVQATPEATVKAVAAPSVISSEERTRLTNFVKRSTGEDNVVFDDKTSDFMIDGDGAISLAEAREHYAASLTAHRQSYYVVNQTKITAVKVYADATVPAVWLTALDNSIANWNASGSRISITRVTSAVTGAIKVVGVNNGANGVIATTYYPDYSGNVGKSCTINTNYNYLSAGQQTFAITHELGHAFGFGHTNSTYGQLVPGTPDTDATSIMNSVCLNWTAFTSYDLLAIRKVYPR